MVTELIAMALAAATTPDATTRDLAIGPEGRQLHGTLVVPAEAAEDAEPVLILAGSGPTDRDGNNPMGVAAAPYRMLADALAIRGIASLRVDKRGIAASGGAAESEEALRVGTYADDARAWASALRGETGARCVWLLGHSEGTLHALLAAQENDEVCGLILVSPMGRRAGDLIREQLRGNPTNAPIVPAAERLLAELEAGRTVPGDDVPPVLTPLFRASVQPFLISMLAVDPTELARSFEGPVLIVHGTTDLQTTAADAERLAESRAGIEVATIEGMNHVLKSAPAERAANMAAYADPDRPLAAGVGETIADFVLNR